MTKKALCLATGDVLGRLISSNRMLVALEELLRILERSNDHYDRRPNDADKEHHLQQTHA